MSNATVNTSDLLAKVAARKAGLTGNPALKPGESALQAKIRIARETAATKAAGEPPSEAANTLPVSSAPATAPTFAPPPEPPLPAWADPKQTPVDPRQLALPAAPAVIRPPPPLPVSDQPVNCAQDFQFPPAVADQAITIDPLLVAALPVPKPKGRPSGSKNAPKPSVEGLDIAALNAFLVSATAYYNFVLATDSKAVQQ